MITIAWIVVLLFALGVISTTVENERLGKSTGVDWNRPSTYIAIARELSTYTLVFLVLT